MPLLKEAVLKTMESRTLTLKDAEILCEVPQRTIMDILSGKVPRGDVIKKVCNGLKIEIDDIVTDPLNMSVHEAAILLSKSDDFIKIAVEQGRLPGCCITTNGIRTFHIPRKKMEEYMGIEKQPFSFDDFIENIVSELISRLNDKKEKTPIQ